MEHVIRNASIDDADAIGAVVVRAWQAAYRGIMPDDYLDGLRAEQRAAMWQRVLADLGPDRWVRVLTVGDQLVGFASCGPESADVSDGETGQLYAINLDPDHWGRGFGRALLADVTRGLGDVGYHTAVLWVATGDERARRLYESEGWTAEGFRVLAVTETPDEVTIEVETTPVIAGCGHCGTRAEAQDRMPVEIWDLPDPIKAGVAFIT